MGLFGAPPLTCGYVSLEIEDTPTSSQTPSGFLVSFLHRSRAARLSVFVFCFVICYLVLSVSLGEIMGQMLVTPLSLTLQHFKEVRGVAHNNFVDVKKGKWQIFCTSEWSIFSVGWPRDVTFNISIIRQVKKRVINPGTGGHPDRVSYIITWESLVVDPPLWPTWDDCQQLLQVLLTSEERQRVFQEVRKQVLGDDGRPTQIPAEIEEAFSLKRP
uniref:uncharacterized protein LOC143310361 isoform X2 n=1 Tax=Arvicanthis niloticus TaxID=61156 RepID=UPI00402B4D47